MGQAKRRGTYEDRVAQAPKKEKTVRQCISYYWGYKADQGDLGFEFSSLTLTSMGVDTETALGVCSIIKESVDHQLKILENNETQMRFNLTREEFIMEEHRRLVGTKNWLNQFIKRHKGKINLADSTVMSQIIIFCCAVSTLVAEGWVPQDNWNGDRFAYYEGEDIDLIKSLLTAQ